MTVEDKLGEYTTVEEIRVQIRRIKDNIKRPNHGLFLRHRPVQKLVCPYLLEDGGPGLTVFVPRLPTPGGQGATLGRAGPRPDPGESRGGADPGEGMAGPSRK